MNIKRAWHGAKDLVCIGVVAAIPAVNSKADDFESFSYSSLPFNFYSGSGIYSNNPAFGTNVNWTMEVDVSTGSVIQYDFNTGTLDVSSNSPNASLTLDVPISLTLNPASGLYTMTGWQMNAVNGNNVISSYFVYDGVFYETYDFASGDGYQTYVQVDAIHGAAVTGVPVVPEPAPIAPLTEAGIGLAVIAAYNRFKNNKKTAALG